MLRYGGKLYYYERAAHQSNLGALFAGISLNQWMALTPPELVQAHLNLDRQTLAGAAQGQAYHCCISAAVSETANRCPNGRTKTIAVLSTAKRGGPRDPDYRSSSDRRSPNLIKIEALSRVASPAARASEGGAHDFRQR